MNTFFLTRQFFGENWPKFGSKSGSKLKKMAQKKIKLAKMVAKEKQILVRTLRRFFDLQSRHEINGLSLSNITKGDNAKSKKGRVVILVRDTSSGPVIHFYQGS